MRAFCFLIHPSGRLRITCKSMCHGTQTHVFATEPDFFRESWKSQKQRFMQKNLEKSRGGGIFARLNEVKYYI